MKRAIYAGSFDLPTIGHEWMITQGSKLFDHLVVGVSVNPYKKYMFTDDERLHMMERVCSKFNNVTVQWVGKEYLIAALDHCGCEFILRGLRSGKDFDEELDLRDFNFNVPTVFMIPPPDYRKVSSSFVKGLVGYNGWENMIQVYIPFEIKKEVMEKLKK